jgi:hypothetical protein
MQDHNLLSAYMMKRGLNEPESQPMKEKILENEELVASIAGTWRTNKDAITAVVLARIMQNKQELVERAIPEEVLILRQIFMELEAVLKDFEDYALEQERREKSAKGNAEGKTT